MTLQFLSLLAIAAIVAPVSAADFELKDGDKVVWLGSTLIEREQRYGYWEAALSARWPDRKITFRNLGWSGDNVFGEARLAFDINRPDLGLKRMVDLTLAEKPTVIFICYGTNGSFEGEAGLEKFEKGYVKLLDALAPAKARIILITPNPFEKAPTLPCPTEANRRLELYVSATKAIAEKRKLDFADFYHQLSTAAVGPLTDNGMHPTERGYQLAVRPLGEALGIKEIGEAAAGNTALRQAIIDKNRLYFYRWRPQNETYLFGFRKHEQGKNAKEIAEFDPLIAKAEEEIDRLKNPKAYGEKSRPVEKK